MNLRSITRWTCVMLVGLMSSAVMGLAFQPATPSTVAHVPEAPTLVLIALGGAGVAWQYFRSRVRK